MSNSKSIITIGDTNYFPSIALSALQARKLHPECSFVIYDWGFTEGEKEFLQGKAGARVIDWQCNFKDNPIPPASLTTRITSTLFSAAPLKVKLMLIKATISDMAKNGQKGKEWLLAQKPYSLLDWSNRNPEGTILFLDGDAFLMAKIDEIWSEQSELAVTVRRNNEINFSYGHCQVINTGVIAFSGTTETRQKIIQSWINTMQGKFEYLAEQSAMTRMVFNHEQAVKQNSVKQFDTQSGVYSARILDCDTYNYNWIEEGVDPIKNKIVHFKGGRHSGERFWDLAKSLGLEKDLHEISKWHRIASRLPRESTAQA